MWKSIITIYNILTVVFAVCLFTLFFSKVVIVNIICLFYYSHRLARVVHNYLGIIILIGIIINFSIIEIKWLNINFCFQ